MKATWHGMPYVVVDDDGEGVFLESVTPGPPPARQYVAYADQALLIDPTDDEWQSAVAHGD